MSAAPRRLTAWLDRAPPLIFALYGGGAAFAAYFAMYAFRKPFTAAPYDAVPGWHGPIDFKVALVIAQVIGYALSKFIGIRVIAEAGAARRGLAIVALIALAWGALLLFALLPAPLKIVALFLNGLPLGLIWGLVFAYLEGRRTTELLAAMLCASFILSSGVVKSAGSALLAHGISPFWMPAATGALFAPLLLVAVLALAALPPPSAAERAERMDRAPMPAAARRAFLTRYAPGIALLVAAYVLLTALRDFRDNFAAELWRELGYGGVAGVFTQSEWPIAAITLLSLASLVLVRGNARALMLVHGLVAFGALLILASTAAFQLGLLSPLAWMIASGLGLYLGYTPFNGILFDRLVAATRTVGTAGFLIYVADAAGYAGSVALLLARDLIGVELPWLRFYLIFCYAAGGLILVAMLGAALYFRRIEPAARG